MRGEGGGDVELVHLLRAPDGHESECAIGAGGEEGRLEQKNVTQGLPDKVSITVFERARTVLVGRVSVIDVVVLLLHLAAGEPAHV